jgi:hypothetical protein
MTPRSGITAPSPGALRTRRSRDRRRHASRGHPAHGAGYGCRRGSQRLPSGAAHRGLALGGLSLARFSVQPKSPMINLQGTGLIPHDRPPHPSPTWLPSTPRSRAPNRPRLRLGLNRRPCRSSSTRRSCGVRGWLCGCAGGCGCPSGGRGPTRMAVWCRITCCDTRLPFPPPPRALTSADRWHQHRRCAMHHRIAGGSVPGRVAQGRRIRNRWQLPRAGGARRRGAPWGWTFGRADDGSQATGREPRVRRSYAAACNARPRVRKMPGRV